MPDDNAIENSIRLRKKRTERQLYVPPAQRNRKLLEENYPHNSENGDNIKIAIRKKESTEIDINKQNGTQEFEAEENIDNDIEIKYRKEIEKLLSCKKCTKSTETVQDNNFAVISWEYRISNSNSSDTRCNNFCETASYPYFNYCHNHNIYKKLPIYSYNKLSSNILYILHNNYALWQPKLDVNYIKDDNNNVNSSVSYPLYNFDQILRISTKDFDVKALLVSDSFASVYEKVILNFDGIGYRAFKVFWNASQCCLNKNDVIDLSNFNYGHIFVTHSENESDYIYDCEEDHSILECYLDKKKTMKSGRSITNVNFDVKFRRKDTKLENNGTINLEKRSKSLDENEAAIKKNNIKNSTSSTDLYISSNELIKNIDNVFRSKKKSSEHEQEKEIMRKTKKYVNRKTRPIMKYLDNTSDKLQINKGDNVTNWEDLFEDEDQLKEELFKKKTDTKVEQDISVVNNEEENSDFTPKRFELLDHMVEVYDFPSSFGTHDIIQAFSDINSDAMYVKWVDDTHAILVLGSLKEAYRAVELDNSLIKVRPMIAASSACLATVYKNDLKPAMKRPQTNLQTARRLITTHLGAKSKVSREQNAKERNDLRAARELKKLTKKNEQDAWEGKIHSSVN